MTEASSTHNELLRANANYLQTFPEPRPQAPARRLSVVACMDSRLALFGALGLQIGDAHLIRNAGGVVTDDVLRSLAISQRRIGTREIAVLHHTDCGMLNFDDDQFRAELLADSQQAPGWDVPGFTDLSESVRQSVRQIVQCRWLPHRDSVQGYIFDVQTGKLSAVD
ncbi:MAG TPA: carbonic anhydrase [Jatrophihabitans sp.]|jgi:carbonic anhydrase|nr:carbonic anhydrase [Jatrophihabitans sp.]